MTNPATQAEKIVSESVSINSHSQLVKIVERLLVEIMQATCKVCDGTGKDRDDPTFSSCSSCGKENPDD